MITDHVTHVKSRNKLIDYLRWKRGRNSTEEEEEEREKEEEEEEKRC